MEKLFHLKENNTTARTEIVAGLTTFMTMAYIIALNPNLLTGFGAEGGTQLWNGVFLATCIASAVGTLVMAFAANKPFAMAPGMGLNSFFAVVVANIVSLTGITDERLQTEGVQPAKAASQIAKLMQNGPTLMIAHNAQFDACFLRGLLRGQKVGRIDWLDSLTVYKDRRAYPHKLANAIIAYDLTGKVQNSHRAIDDVLALFEVLKAMDDEREDLGSYVNLFGYNPKYGVSGRRIVGVRYEPQSFSKGLTRPEQTLPARVARR